EARTLEHLVRGEPWLRIVGVRIGAEAGKGREAASCPLPQLAPAHGMRPRGPFRLARQPLACPAAIRLRLVPAHVPHWLLQRERRPAIEAPLLPCAAGLAPIARRPAAGFYVAQILSIRDRPRSDRKGRYLDVVRPLLVVEDEALLVALGAEAERAACELQEFGEEFGDGARISSGSVPEFMFGVAEGLGGVGESPGVRGL